MKPRILDSENNAPYWFREIRVSPKGNILRLPKEVLVRAEYHPEKGDRLKVTVENDGSGKKKIVCLVLNVGA